ncbi:MAG: tRNA epoxyqueuosine(34) reductase QueG [Anaerolineae bacterium]|nr:MAG: tRNA epoxyqueuosine(34) reductase QueG [Anaerolineae bacterium]
MASGLLILACECIPRLDSATPPQYSTAVSPENLAKRLKAEAARLGFVLAGITTPDSPESAPRFQAWLAAGRHAGMAYLATDASQTRRADPRAILPECRSILALAVPYDNPASIPASANGGRVAAYAWGEDYHDVLLPRLRALVAFLEAETGGPFPHRYYTDTGPLLERDLARRAGLGWIGKNSMLIHPERGSYFLLAEILLGLDLPPDSAIETDHCGSCTRCLEACPTRCILPDRTLDAGRCISYLTIELKGSIPTELRPALGEWVFGCDICQQVCPWNERFAPERGDPAFAPRPGMTSNDLAGILGLTAKGYSREFKGSPVTRAKRRGLLRNAAVALGVQGREEDIPALVAALRDPEPLVRGHAAWALGQIGGKAARAALEVALEEEMDEGVRGEIRAALE